MQLAASAAQKTRNETKKLMGFSKQWQPGDTLRVWYPIFRDENGKPQIAVGTVWGFPVNDMKALGLKTVFIPSTNEFDGNGAPIGQPDITYQFSRMAPLFVAGEKQSKLDKIAGKNYPNETLRLQAFAQVEKEYSRDAKDPIKPVIGKATYQIMTECLSIKKKGSAFDPETIAISSRTMPDDLITKLYTIMSNNTYAPGPEDMFLEVEWAYPVNTSKTDSGRTAVPAGITPEYRISTTDPELWKTIMARMNGVSTDSNSIVKRATYEVELSRVRQGIQSYISNQSEWLECLAEEDEERLMKSIDLIRDLEVKRMLSKQTLIARIDEALAEAKSQMAENIPPVQNPPVVDGSPNLDSILAQNQSNIPADIDLTGAMANLSVEQQAMANMVANQQTMENAAMGQQTMPTGGLNQQAAALGVSADIQRMMTNPNNSTNMMDTNVDLNLDV